MHVASTVFHLFEIKIRDTAISFEAGGDTVIRYEAQATIEQDLKCVGFRATVRPFDLGTTLLSHWATYLRLRSFRGLRHG